MARTLLHSFKKKEHCCFKKKKGTLLHGSGSICRWFISVGLNVKTGWAISAQPSTTWSTSLVPSPSSQRIPLVHTTPPPCSPPTVPQSRIQDRASLFPDRVLAGILPPPNARCRVLRRRRAPTRYSHPPSLPCLLCKAEFPSSHLAIWCLLTYSNSILVGSEVRDWGRWPCSHPRALPSTELPLLGRASAVPRRIPFREGFSMGSSSHVPLPPMHSDTTGYLYLIPTLLIDFILDLLC
jgi:hypothetical protein